MKYQNLNQEGGSAYCLPLFVQHNMKQASLSAQKEQYNIDTDTPFSVKLGRLKFKLRYLKQATANRISLEDVSRKELIGKDVKASLMANGRITAKVISLAILATPIKIKLFHWLLWRYIYNYYSVEEAHLALATIMGKLLQISFFFQSLALIEDMNQLTMKMTEVEAKSYQVELESALKRTS